MKKAEKENWLINLKDVSSQVDAETVRFVCGKYGSNATYRNIKEWFTSRCS